MKKENVGMNKKGQEETIYFFLGLIFGAIVIAFIFYTWVIPNPNHYLSTYNLSSGEIISCNQSYTENCGTTFLKCVDVQNNSLENITFECQTNYQILIDCENGCKIE